MSSLKATALPTVGVLLALTWGQCCGGDLSLFLLEGLKSASGYFCSCEDLWTTSGMVALIRRRGVRQRLVPPTNSIYQCALCALCLLKNAFVVVVVVVPP